MKREGDQWQRRLYKEFKVTICFRSAEKQIKTDIIYLFFPLKAASVKTHVTTQKV